MKNLIQRGPFVDCLNKELFILRELKYIVGMASFKIKLEDHSTENDNESQSGVLEKTRAKTKKPSLYKVILLNDDYTPMEFVILVLMKFFKKSEQEATEVMLNVHHKGSGLAGVYPFEVAETKVHQVNSFAKSQKHPLKCIMEKE